MNKKLLVVAIFAVAAVAAMADNQTGAQVTPTTASVASQNIGAGSNQAAITNTINAASTAAQAAQATPAFTGNLSIMGGIKPAQQGIAQYDNPNGLNLNYQYGNWTTSLNGSLEFEGKVNSGIANQGTGNQSLMMNTWGVTQAYNFQNGWTTSLNVSYLNWRGQSNDPTGEIYPVLVTGYQLAPNATYVNGNNTFAIATVYQVVGSSNGNSAITSSSGQSSESWNGGNGQYFSIFPVYTNQVTPDFSYGTGVQLQQANDNFIILSKAVNNGSNNSITWHPAMLSYNVPSVSGLNLNFDSRWQLNTTVANDPIQKAGGTPGQTQLKFLPGVAYTMTITPDLSWTTNAQVYAQYNTNGFGVNGEYNRTASGAQTAVQYGGQIYTGFNYAF